MAKKTKKNPETIAVSIPKALQTKSEDAFIVREDGLLAIADGAGGVGIFAAEWAKYLLDSLPETPFTDADAFVLWTNSIWETFYQRIDNQEIAMEVKSKFMEEGSLATLAILAPEATPRLSPKGKEIRSVQAFCYGDSAVMVYHPKKNTLRALPDTLATYTQHPYLINWKEEVHTAGVLMRTFELSKQDKLLLCSDAIAQFLLLSYSVLTKDSDWAAQLTALQSTHSEHRIFGFVENMKAFFAPDATFLTAVWQPLLEAVQDENTFTTWAYGLCEKGLLVSDDYTLIMKEIK